MTEHDSYFSAKSLISNQVKTHIEDNLPFVGVTAITADNIGAIRKTWHSGPATKPMRQPVSGYAASRSFGRASGVGRNVACIRVLPRAT